MRRFADALRPTYNRSRPPRRRARALLTAVALAACSDGGSGQAVEWKRTDKLDVTGVSDTLRYADASEAQRQLAQKAIQATYQGFANRLEQGSADVVVGVCDAWQEEKGSYTVVLNPGLGAGILEAPDGKKNNIHVTFGSIADSAEGSAPDTEEVATGPFQFMMSDGVVLVSERAQERLALEMESPTIEIGPTGLPFSSEFFQGDDGRWTHIAPITDNNGEEIFIPIFKQGDFSGSYDIDSVRDSCDELMKGFPLTADQVKEQLAS